MTHVTGRLTAKNRDQLRNPTLGNRVWATFTFSCTCVCSAMRIAQLGRGADDDETDLRLSETGLRRRDAAGDEYDDGGGDVAADLLKRLVAGDVAKRRFCRHNYVYNPVSGRCQASLLVRSNVARYAQLSQRLTLRVTAT